MYPDPLLLRLTNRVYYTGSSWDNTSTYTCTCIYTSFFSLYVHQIHTCVLTLREPCSAASRLSQYSTTADTQHNSLSMTEHGSDLIATCQKNEKMAAKSNFHPGEMAQFPPLYHFLALLGSPGHLTSMKKLFGLCTSLFSLCLRFSSSRLG